MEANKVGYVTLASWAKTHQVSVSYDSATATASFSYGSKSIRLPLASNKAVVNGREVDLEGKFILARGNLWFVPGEELSRALG
jgi:hypothetical protein